GLRRIERGSGFTDQFAVEIEALKRRVRLMREDDVMWHVECHRHLGADEIGFGLSTRGGDRNLPKEISLRIGRRDNEKFPSGGGVLADARRAGAEIEDALPMISAAVGEPQLDREVLRANDI